MGRLENNQTSVRSTIIPNQDTAGTIKSTRTLELIFPELSVRNAKGGNYKHSDLKKKKKKRGGGGEKESHAYKLGTVISASSK